MYICVCVFLCFHDQNSVPMMSDMLAAQEVNVSVSTYIAWTRTRRHGHGILKELMGMGGYV